jgi:hypothetical protein
MILSVIEYFHQGPDASEIYTANLPLTGIDGIILSTKWY